MPLDDPDRAADLLIGLRDAGIGNRAIERDKPTLDEVFLALTGHEPPTPRPRRSAAGRAHEEDEVHHDASTRRHRGSCIAADPAAAVAAPRPHERRRPLANVTMAYRASRRCGATPSSSST